MDKKIPELNGIPGTAIDDADLLVVEDVSANETKNTAFSQLKVKVLSWFSNFGASGPNHKAGLVPDPGATAGTTKALLETGAFGDVTQLKNLYSSLKLNPDNGNLEFYDASDLLVAYLTMQKELVVVDMVGSSEHYIISALINYGRRFGLYVDAGAGDGGFKSESLLRFKFATAAFFTQTGSGSNGLYIGTQNGALSLFSYDTLLTLGLADPNRIVSVVSGKFGVGTTSPSAASHVINVNSSQPIRISQRAPGQNPAVTANSSADDHLFLDASGNTLGSFFYDSNKHLYHRGASGTVTHIANP